MSSTSSCDASASARGGRCGSSPFSHLLDPSVRRPSRIEERWVEGPSKFAHSSSDGRRLVGHLAPLRPHEARDGRRPLCVGDHEHLGIQSARLAVEGRHRLACGRPADDDLAPGDLVEVERVGGLADREHDVVRDVDDVRDRAHAGCGDAGLEPGRRRAHLDVGEHPAGPPRAQIGSVDPRGDVVVGRAGALGRRLGPRPWREIRVERRRDLAGDAVNVLAVGPVRRDLELEHVVGDGQVVDEGVAHRPVVGQEHDPVVLLAQVELALREHHPVRLHAAQLCDPKLGAVGQHRARERDGDRCARGEVRCTADDAARVTVADVDGAQAEAVGVRVPVAGKHAADPVELQAPGDATAVKRLELRPRHRHQLAQLGQWHLERDVVAQPRDGHPHPNCSVKRRSFSQSSRMSGMSWRRPATRSTPRPNANPDTSSGS